MKTESDLAPIPPDQRLGQSQSTPGLMQSRIGRTAKTAGSRMQETMALFNSVYTGGFSSYLSSNTLRNSPKHWSFSKADRFLQKIPDNTAKYNAFPTVLSSRYSTFGFGERSLQKDLPAAHSPPPTQYRIPSPFEPNKTGPIKGKTFGIARGYYQNVYVPNQDNVAPRIASQIPGPGQYSPLEANPLGKNAKKFTLKSRVPPCTSATREFPAPNMYKPGHILTEQSRFNGVGFGVGNRGSSTGPTRPGTYRLPSPFDKFTRISLIGKIHTLKPIKLPKDKSEGAAGAKRNGPKKEAF